ncbi:MAG TPA: malto-oligosyltrehalose trehalohydrolase [Candidatus Acidoferrum sp.]|nr:malto-oligosyltrehalose trehalohydrolase [Candidatus Acidoferrum sp.]
MHTFRVWATLPKRVEVQVSGCRHEMRPEKGGWWTEDVASAGPGSDYGFILDGQGPYPDPRSPWQPRGVHGLSRVVAHDRFNWSDAGFRAPPLGQAVIYECHIGTFTPEGTFEAAEDKLEHLLRLGVTHLELMPVAEFPGHHGWGYDGVDLFAPHQPYGGPEALKKLINACHTRGLAVLLDVVYNHLGPSGNYLSKYAPYFTDRYHTPWGWALNFDGAHSDEVRRFFCDNACMWLRDYHFDGLRLDAVHAIFDSSARPFLEQLGDEVRQLSRQLGRPRVLIPESDLNDPRLLWPPERGGFGLDAQWNDDFHHALHAVLTGERTGYYADFGSLADLAKALRNAFVYDGRFSTLRQRSHGRPPVGLDGLRFLGYAQTHDQVGNRAQGERLGRLVTMGRLKAAAALVFTSPFVPMIFQGEEWGASTPFQYFTDHTEPELAKAVTAGRRREFAAFGWLPEQVPDPQAPETFQGSKLNWGELSRAPHAGLLDWHRQLIALRRGEPALADGGREAVQTCFDESARWLVVERGPIAVVCQLSERAQRVPLADAAYAVLLASDPSVAPGGGYVAMPRDSVAILRRRQ